MQGLLVLRVTQYITDHTSLCRSSNRVCEPHFILHAVLERMRDSYQVSRSISSILWHTFALTDLMLSTVGMSQQRNVNYNHIYKYTLSYIHRSLYSAYILAQNPFSVPSRFLLNNISHASRLHRHIGQSEQVSCCSDHIVPTLSVHFGVLTLPDPGTSI